jgi:archaeosortase B (VPXXXP-CTERM-specific)
MADGPSGGASPRLPRLRRLLASQEVLFPLKLVVVAVALHALWTASRAPTAALREATTSLTAAASTLTGLRTKALPDSVLTFAGESFAYQVTDGCTAWVALLLYTSAVLAYPARWPQRARGLALGIPLVLALNVVRLVSMAWIGVRWPALFDSAHGIWWQTSIVVAVGLGWLAWARHVEDERRESVERGRLRTLGRSLCIVVATVAAAWFLGTATGAIEAYGRTLESLAAAWTSAMGLPAGRPDIGPDVYRRWGGIAAITGLYLATPRVALRARALGAVTLGAGVQFVLDVLVIGWLWATMGGGAGRLEDNYLLGTIFSRAGAVALWFLWARRHWRPAPAQAASYDCPSCGAATTDPLAHVREAHPDNPRKWTRAVLRAHPELRAASQKGAPSAAREPA